jgi:tetratricopeptide (TPR) repeat protein
MLGLASALSTATPAEAAKNSSARSHGVSLDPLLAKANKLAGSGQYQEASKIYYQMSQMPQYAKGSAQIKYIMGMMLYEMKLNQAAAFVFFDVIREESKTKSNSKYLKQSLEKLVLVADALDSDTLLRYAMKQIDDKEFPPTHLDMLFFRRGEVKLAEKSYPEAIREFSRVRQGSIFHNRARYSLALAYSESGDTEHAASVFNELASGFDKITDRNRVNALLGKARALYQGGKFDDAIEAYRDIPRDTEQWPESLFESSWAMLRDGRFRSALSNFHSLHSDFYEDVYQPESLYLRAIVYLYICRYDEMAKVLDLFEKIYQPVLRDVSSILETVSDPNAYFREISNVRANYESLRSGAKIRTSLNIQIPFLVARHISREGDVQRSFAYLAKLEEESRRISKLPVAWRSAGIGKYSAKILEKRIDATRMLIGNQSRNHLLSVQSEIRDLNEQDGYLRFEMLSGKKEILRKEIAGKTVSVDAASTQVDQNTNRNFYIQNGYEYWPFKGEYWLDEIGNYQYVGVKACE